MEELFKKIYRTHRRTLRNTDSRGEKLLIAFAGIPGSGKTTIAKELEESLKAVRINSIDVEKAYVALENERDISTKRAYIDWLMNKIVKEFKNKTIILDKGIERTYEHILDWCKENSYKVFIVGVNCSRKTAEKRIVMREGVETAKDYLAEMSRWLKEYEAYRKLGISDIEINTEEEILSVWRGRILKKLKQVRG